MKTTKPAPRHHVAHCPSTDSVVEGVNVSGTVRPIAFMSTTGVALTAIAAGVVDAAPAAPQSEPQGADLDTTTAAVDDVTIIEVPDTEWTAEEDATASATAEAPVSAPTAMTPAADQSDSVVSRSEVRSDATSDTPVRQATLNTAGGNIVPIALGLTGTPYVYGGGALDGLDCSGLVGYVYVAAGTNLSHSLPARATGGIIVSGPQPGDIVSYPGHVVVYIGGGQMVEVTVPGRLSQVSPVRPGATYVRYQAYGT